MNSDESNHQEPEQPKAEENEQSQPTVEASETSTVDEANLNESTVDEQNLEELIPISLSLLTDRDESTNDQIDLSKPLSLPTDQEDSTVEEIALSTLSELPPQTEVGQEIADVESDDARQVADLTQTVANLQRQEQELRQKIATLQERENKILSEHLAQTQAAVEKNAARRGDRVGAT